MKIAIVGVGGRTGTMLAFELKKSGFDVLGFGQKNEVELIKEKKVYLQRGLKEEIFDGQVLFSSDFGAISQLGNLKILFFAVKNPVEEVVRYYAQKIKEMKILPPAFFLSQNGIEAGEKTISILKEIFGPISEKIDVLRLIIFNPVEKKFLNEKIKISYSLPIKIAISKISGPKKIEDFLPIFSKNHFKILRVEKESFKNLEYSKLFLNLIGIPCASFGFSIKQGFSYKNIFGEEILALREYAKVIKLAGGKFLNFPSYPVKLLSLFVEKLPLKFLIPFRKLIAFFIEKEREGKAKDLSEIDFYTGAVVNLAQKLKIEVPTNEKVLKRAKNLLK